MSKSPADAVSRAVERTQRLLFPFNAGKWFALGFTAFLAQCGEGGGSLPSLPTDFGSPGSSASSGFDLGGLFDRAVDAVAREAAFYLTLAGVGVVVVLGLWLTIVWFSSRAKLMFVESVVWERVELGSQWTRAATLGMSLSKFRVALGFSGGLLLLGAFAGAFATALPDLRSGDFFGGRALSGYAVLAGAALILGLPLAATFALLDDFVVPLMVLRNATVTRAWSMCRDEVLNGNLGGLAVFYLLRFALGFGIAIAAMVLTCVTCCATAIPYLGTVLLLPLFVFSRLFPLCYLQELGITVFPAQAPSWTKHDEWRFPT
jgi:hypothetical protein